MNLHGDHNQCQGCKKYFNSSTAFDKHRIGEHTDNQRRCMTTEEMESRKMAINTRGFWVTALMPTSVLAEITE